MDRILILLAMLVVGNVYALPPCPSSPPFDNCYGTRTELFPEDRYVGEFRNDKYHGKGTLILQSGGKYLGEFKDGQIHGQGTYTYPDGKKFVGEHQQNRVWTGVLYRSNGTVMANALEGVISIPN